MRNENIIHAREMIAYHTGRRDAIRKFSDELKRSVSLKFEGPELNWLNIKIEKIKKEVIK